MPMLLDALTSPELVTGGPGQPMMLPLDAIDEDPEQPRREFDPESLREIADSIAEHGVMQPISVRSHARHPGRWMINFGARRLRGAKLAGVTEVPVFVDERMDSYRQVVENEQRENLKPIELAMFVQRELEAGRSRAEVARRLGKSKAYVTQVCALIDAPDCVLQAYREGRCRGVSELYELRKLHESAPDAAAQLLKGTERVSRSDVAGARPHHAESVAAGALSPKPCVSEQGHETRGASAKVVAVGRPSDRPGAEPLSLRPIWSPIALTGLLDGVRVRVVLDRVPDDKSQVFVLNGEGPAWAVPVTQVIDLRLGRT